MTMRQNIAVAIVEHEGRFLVGQRGDDAPLPGQHEFPGGKVESGETPAEAAVRECFEETNVRAKVNRRLAVVDHDYEHGPIRIHFYLCSLVSSGVTPAAPFRWIPRSDLATCEFPEANASVFGQLWQDESR